MLPAETQKVWAVLEKEPTLAGAILIGGTALALQIGHRRSYDLDLCFCTQQLPIRQIDRVIAALEGAGITAQRSDDPAAYDEFLNAGMSLHDFQQDFLTNQGVKLTFLAADADAATILNPGCASGPRVASLEEIFRLKALVSAKRSNSRDWFDLYVLMTQHGFSIRDFADTFHRTCQELSLDIAFNRLCSGRTAPDDPGFEALCDEPPTLDTLRAYFVAERNGYEVESARASKSQGDR